MSIIQVYKSDSDGRLFEDKKKYIQHLRQLAICRIVDKRISKVKNDRKTFMTDMGQVKNIDELTQFIKDNWSWFFYNSISDSFYYKLYKKGKSLKIPQLVAIRFSDISFRMERNSHSSPLNGVSNFEIDHPRNKGKPTHYPAWRGSLSFTLKTDNKSITFGSSFFDNTIINTGTGGGIGSNSYRYSVTLWAADFPVMWEIISRKIYLEQVNQERIQIWNTLGGKKKPSAPTVIPDDWVCPDPLICTDIPDNLVFDKY